MTTDKSTGKLKIKAYLIVLTHALLVWLVLIVLENNGALEGWELANYDRLVRSQNPTKNTEIVFCKITEADYREFNLDHMRDELLAQIINRLQAHAPKLIGLDIIKDRKVGEGSEALKLAFDKGNVIGVMALGNEIGGEPDASYPYVLDCDNLFYQTGFADLEVDDSREEVIRRVGLASMVKIPECNDADPEGHALAFSFGSMLATREIYNELKASGAQLKDFIQWQRQDLYQADYNAFKIGKNQYSQFLGNEGGYSRNAQYFEYLIDFAEEESSFDSFTLTELLEGRVDGLRINNKIVLVGSTAASKKDSYPTPRSDWSLGKGKMPGVVIHGVIASQILRGFRLRNSMIHNHSNILEGLWVLIWCILGAALTAAMLVPLRTCLALGAAFVSLILISHLLFSWSWWLPTVSASLGLIGSGLVLTVFHSRYRRQSV